MKNPKDPGTWPALIHRLTATWAALLRLLVALAVVTAMLALTWWLLGLSSVQVGPVEIRQLADCVLCPRTFQDVLAAMSCTAAQALGTGSSSLT